MRSHNNRKQINTQNLITVCQIKKEPSPLLGTFTANRSDNDSDIKINPEDITTIVDSAIDRNQTFIDHYNQFLCKESLKHILVKSIFSAYELGLPKDKIDDFTKLFLMDLIANNYNMDVFREHINTLIGRYFAQNNIQ